MTTRALSARTVEDWIKLPIVGRTHLTLTDTLTCRWAHACASRVQGPALAVAGMSRSGMARDRDVAAFGERAQGYDEGWRGELHHQIADRAADLALACVPAPRRILDVGC